jgi:hypothetical protein
MKKFLYIIIILFTITCANLANATTISGGISATEQVPKGFFGTWKVVALRTNTSNSNMFAPNSIEIWNLSKSNDVITLTNPISGATASISVKEATSDTFTFQRVTGDKNETVTETAKLILNGPSFKGSDTMVVRTYKNGTLIKTENVVYSIQAFKLTGSDIRNILSAW